MRAEHSSAQSATPQILAVVLATFAVGLGCGWWLKPLLNADQSAASSVPPDASRAEMRSVFPASGEEVSTFISRLADVLSIASRGKRERALAAIANDLDAAQLRDALAQLEKTRISNLAEVRAKSVATAHRVGSTAAQRTSA